MQSWILLGIVGIYFLLLLVIAYLSSRNSNNDSFFIGNRKSNWMLVSFGMIGTSLSGVTFVSVPGTVGTLLPDGSFSGFQYLQLVFGFFIGYFVVAFVLLPLYYRFNLTSIYTYLDKRFGNEAHKVGSIFFIISRSVGATARLYLVIFILQFFLLENLGISFELTTLIILLMVLLYTFEGGVKTIVITDTLQTTFMVMSLLVVIGYILQTQNWSLNEAFSLIQRKGYDTLWNTNASSAGFFLKSIIGGAFITISMTGLDQEMMQKNISVDKLKNSQKNMIAFATIMVLVNILFLFLGALLYLFAAQNGSLYKDGGFILNEVNLMGDDLFPYLAINNYLSPIIAIVFLIGLTSALFPSADGALTSLTSSFCVDILKLKEQTSKTEEQKKHTRLWVHLSFTIIFFLLILLFKWINDKSIVFLIMTLAGYTYGPLLGLFAFGIFTRRTIQKKFLITLVALLSPFITYILKEFIFPAIGYNCGFELIAINGLITFLGLFMVSSKKTSINHL